MFDTKSFFNDRAPVWDQFAGTQDPEILCIMLTLSDIRPGSTVLDVGCGTGALEPYLLAHSPSRIIAVDFAEKMIEAAKAKLAHPAVEFVCVDFFDLAGLQANQCFFVSSFPHFPDPERAVRHAASLLKPGGRLTISNIQGKYISHNADILNPMLPAQTLVNVLWPYFRLDVIIDNRMMSLISGTKLHEPRNVLSDGGR